ncbi:B1 protein [Tribolium castaneum]|uniref:Odorant binding protein C02 n=1 Tax=Tribolium castaneum TaxID=7070 RepID=D6WS43_TRICA|nr:PREDICTED: B1 protein [Tribolium castaneum]EFA07545.1 odorant binding protein C02 [Tribolium castaneum]|eukprot:XP_015837507.1 PREDICTED: B1 protein [Tribolium castaneum]
MNFVCVIFILVAIIGAHGLSEQQTEKLNQLSKECRALTGVSQETITNARNGNFEEDPKLKLQVLCIGKKVGIMNESSQIDENVLKAKLRKVSDNDEEVNKIYNKCAVKKPAPEETAFETIKCVMKNKPKFSPVE